MAPSSTFHSDPEEAAETYVLQRMAPAELAAYREHLESCPSCMEAVDNQRLFVEAMRAAMHQIAEKEKTAPRSRKRRPEK